MAFYVSNLILQTRYLIVIEILFIIFCLLFDRKRKNVCQWIGVLIPLFVLILLLSFLPTKLHSSFSMLHKSKSLSVATGLLTFLISNVLLDMPSWREGMEKYSLTPLGKWIKYNCSLSIVSFTIGIYIWQHVPYEISIENFVTLLMCIALFGFLPVVIGMGIADFIQSKKRLFNLLYYKEKRNLIVHIHGRKKKRHVK